MTSKAGFTAQSSAEDGIGCPYCTALMPPEGFAAWPGQPRLITAECAGCARTVTLPSQWLARFAIPAQAQR